MKEFRIVATRLPRAKGVTLTRMSFEFAASPDAPPSWLRAINGDFYEDGQASATAEYQSTPFVSLLDAAGIEFEIVRIERK